MQRGVSLFRCAGRFASAMACASVLLISTTAITAARPPGGARTAHPNTVHIAEAAERFGLRANWIRAVMHVESGGDPRAVSRAGAIGLMQIMPSTWTDLTARYGLGDDPWNARANILAGAAYLHELFERYADLPTALAAYNAGPGRVDAWLTRGRPLPLETVAYVDQIAPLIGKSSATLPTTVRAIAATSWRTASIFIPRHSDSETTTEGAAPPPPMPNSAPPALSTMIVSERARGDLFVPRSVFDDGRANPSTGQMRAPGSPNAGTFRVGRGLCLLSCP